MDNSKLVAIANRAGTDGTEPARLLVVGDDVPILDLLSTALRSAGYLVRTAGPDADVVEVMRRWKPHLMVHDDIQVMQFRQGRPASVPAVHLTSGDRSHGPLLPLTAGISAYVTKPFSLEDLLAAARAVLRRASGDQPQDAGDSVLRFADLQLDEETFDVHRAGRSVRLTPTEFDLLRYLVRNPEKVLTRAQILDHVWSYNYSGDSKIVELYIFKLRRKIDSVRPPLIHTLRGRGYSLRLPRT